MATRNPGRTALVLAVAAAAGLAFSARSASAAMLIGPGADITNALQQDTPGGERLNVDRTTFVTLPAGEYEVNDWRLNVFSNTEGGTITPMLLSGPPSSYTIVWLGSAFDPTSNGVQTVAETGTFTLGSSTDIYAGIFTAGSGSGIIALDQNNAGTGNSRTDHDNSFVVPTAAGQTVAGFSHTNLGRTYAFEVNVDLIPEPATLSMILAAGLPALLRC